MSDKVTAWVTAYALTAGIIKAEGELFAEGSGFKYKPDGSYFDNYVHGKDFHMTEEAAKTRAGEMRDKKLASIEKQRQKLLKLVF